MGSHAVAALPKPADYLAPQQQQQQQQRHRRPSNHWTLPRPDTAAFEEGVALGWEDVSSLSSSPPESAAASGGGGGAAAAAAIVPLPTPLSAAPPMVVRRPAPRVQGADEVPQPQPPSRQPSCNINLPLSPAAAF
jgi:hypothetical protein